MATPISEQIAATTRTRLAAISTDSGYEVTISQAVRPTKQGGFRPQDNTIVVTEISNGQVNIFPSATPKIEKDLRLSIHGVLRPSDVDPTAIGTLLNTFAADITKAIKSLRRLKNRAAQVIISLIFVPCD